MSFGKKPYDEDRMLEPGDPLYDRIQRIRDHLAGDRPKPRPEWMDALESYKPTDPLDWPRGGPYRYVDPGTYPDQSGSMNPSSVAAHCEAVAEFARSYIGLDTADWSQATLNHAWECASPEVQAAAMASAEAIIEGTFTFVGESNA